MSASPLVDVAARLALYGLPARRYLTTDDTDERRILELVVARAEELRVEHEKSQANAIANAFVKARLG